MRHFLARTAGGWSGAGPFLAALAGLAVAAAGQGALWAEGGAGPLQPPVEEKAKEPWRQLLQGLEQFHRPDLYAEIGLALLVAAVLGAAIAYHPRRFGKAATLEEAEQPKTFILYSVVGALAAQIVAVRPEMAFVLFGIGGLFRFRTDVGAAKDTGPVILVTLVGLCCGLGIYLVAIISTGFGWVLIHFLEGRLAHRVLVKGLAADVLAKAADAYQEVLAENGLQVLSQKKNFLKGQVAFVLRAPGALDREQLEQLFKDIPPKLQGAVDWESA